MHAEEDSDLSRDEPRLSDARIALDTKIHDSVGRYLLTNRSNRVLSLTFGTHVTLWGRPADHRS